MQKLRVHVPVLVATTDKTPALDRLASALADVCPGGPKLIALPVRPAPAAEACDELTLLLPQRKLDTLQLAMPEQMPRDLSKADEQLIQEQGVVQHIQAVLGKARPLTTAEIEQHVSQQGYALSETVTVRVTHFQDRGSKAQRYWLTVLVPKGLLAS